MLYDQPEAISGVHLSYLKSGADIISTASYQASRDGFTREGFSETGANDLLRRSVKIAMETRDSFWEANLLIESHHHDNRNHGDMDRGCAPPLVAASMGSYGAVLCNGAEFTGDFGDGVAKDPELLTGFHLERMELLALEHPDLLLFETIPSLAEAQAIRQAILKSRAHWEPVIPVMVSFSCATELTVCHGEPLADCVDVFVDLPEVVAVGVNCTAPHLVEGLLRSAKERLQLRGSEKALLCYPNSGEQWLADERRFKEDPEVRQVEVFQTLTRRLLDQGLVHIMGGCCRTTPEIIREGVANEIHGHNHRHHRVA